VFWLFPEDNLPLYIFYAVMKQGFLGLH